MSDIINPNSVKSYTDFSALGELRGKAQRNEAGALRESAQQFEALFIQMMLKSMREASNVMKSDMFQSNAMETFQGMYDKEISMQMASRNALGFADVVVKQTHEFAACKPQPHGLAQAGVEVFQHQPKPAPGTFED